MNKSDPFGEACLAYLKGIRGLEIIVKSDHSEDDIIPVDYLFRPYNEMPLLEQTALNLCKGKTLDIGAGAGCHSKHLINKGVETVAIDLSKGNVKAMVSQGLNAIQTDFFNFPENKKFDTLLALMNGTGICGTEERFPEFLKKCKNLLVKDGQLLIDSSDIIYLFDNEDELQNHSKGKYYGQVKYQMVFDNNKTGWFDWIYFSFDKLKNLCVKSNMNCELIVEGDHYDYLARISAK